MTETLRVGIIGTGWCGGIRAVTCANSALVDEMQIAEVKEDRLAEVKGMTNPSVATTHWEKLLSADLDLIMVSATPETAHYPMAKAVLESGKHLLLEKPMAVTLDEADDLIEIAETSNLKFTIGYSQRFNAKQALAKRSIDDGSLGNPVSILISRHIARSLGAKIGSRTKLSPAAMESTHDLDFAMWLLEPRRPVRVYSQLAWGARAETDGVPDVQYVTVTMDDGVVINVGGGWSLPPGYPNFSSTWMEVIGTEGALLMDAGHKDIVFNTMSDGVQFPLSTMPGEFVDHMYAGPMERETTHFLEAVAYDREVMVKPRLARQTMEVYLAADLSADRSQVVELPLDPKDVEHLVAKAIGSGTTSPAEPLSMESSSA